MRSGPIVRRLVAFLGLLTTGVPSLAPAANGGGWSLDGIRLGAKIDQIAATRGKPSSASGNIFEWKNAAGGTLHVESDRYGNVVDINVMAGPHEVRAVSLPAALPQSGAVFGESGHVNYVAPPGAVFLSEDYCKLLGMGVGNPCESYKLPDGAILVVDFGNDAGGADWLLSEVVLTAPGYLKF